MELLVLKIARRKPMLTADRLRLAGATSKLLRPGRSSRAQALCLALIMVVVPRAGMGSAHDPAVQQASAVQPESAAPQVSASATVAAGPQPATQAAEPSSDPDGGWTPADYINSRLPQWLRLTGEFRNRVEGRTSYAFA